MNRSKKMTELQNNVYRIHESDRNLKAFLDFMAQHYRGTIADQVAVFMDETVLEFAEIKMLTVGDPRIRKKFELDTDIQKLRLEESQHIQQKMKYQKIIEDSPEKIEAVRSRLNKVNTDISAEEGFKDSPFSMTVGKTTYDDRVKAGEALMAYMRNTPLFKHIEIGRYHNAAVSVYRRSMTDASVHIQNSHDVSFVASDSALGNIRSIEGTLSRLLTAKDRLSNELAQYEANFKSAKEGVKQDFAKADVLKLKLAQKAQLDFELAQDQNKGGASNDLNKDKDEIAVECKNEQLEDYDDEYEYEME